jgi:hypothetical protein
VVEIGSTGTQQNSLWGAVKQQKVVNGYVVCIRSSGELLAAKWIQIASRFEPSNRIAIDFRHNRYKLFNIAIVYVSLIQMISFI